MQVPFLILSAAFLTAVFFILGAYRVLFSSRLAVQERLQKSVAASSFLPQGQGEASPARNFGEDFLHFLGALGSMTLRRKNLKNLQRQLLQAHIFMRSEEFLGLSLFSGIAAFCTVFLLTGSFLAALPCSLIAYKIPDFYVELKKNRRLNALTQQLPDALAIVSSGLKAGFSFPQAVSVVGREMGAPIGEEINRLLWENRMGKPMEEALLNMAERTGSYDMNLLVTALLIQRQLGGNLAEILDNISQTIRERVRIRGEIRTLTAQGRLSAVIIILLPLAVAGFLMIMNPEYMLTLFQEPLGLVMLFLALVMQFVGIFLIHRIINIDI